MSNIKTISFKCDEIYYNKFLAEAKKRHIPLGELMRSIAAKGMAITIEEEKTDNAKAVRLLEEALSILK
jgi:hypothetical protein